MNTPHSDVSFDQAEIPLPLERVGMTEIAVPVHLDSGEKQPASVNAFVNLVDPQARGIHMSRLFLLIQKTLSESPLSFELLEQVAKRILESHQGLSTQCVLQVRLDYLIQGSSLKSGLESYKAYPVVYSLEWNGQEAKKTLHADVTYSSTCPMSSALSKEALVQDLNQHFKKETLTLSEMLQWLEKKSLPSPHSQRSLAKVEVVLKRDLSPKQLIQAIEEVLKTPVQGAVKRADEQEFARLNGNNTMFCEDAARRIKKLLLDKKEVASFKAKVTHFESLHAHNAVSQVWG